MAWKVSRWPGKFPVDLDSFQIAWKVSRWPGKFPVGLKCFQIAWNVSIWPGKFPDGLDSFQMAWKVSRWPGKFPDSLEAFYVFQKKTFQVYKNFPGSIATLLPCFFRLCGIIIMTIIMIIFIRGRNHNHNHYLHDNLHQRPPLGPGLSLPVLIATVEALARSLN